MKRKLKDKNIRTIGNISLTSPKAKELSTIFLNAAYGGDINSDKPPKKKKIAALLNPFGGKGKAKTIWSEAKSLFD